MGLKLRANLFPGGHANFGEAMYRSQERSLQAPRNEFDLYRTQASFVRPRVDLARSLRRIDFRLFWFISFEFVKVCALSFSSWESFIGFYIWCYPISTTVACLFRVGGRNSCWKGSMAAKMPSRSSYLLYYIVWSVNLSILSRKFVWALASTTTNCIACFIDFYQVFPTNFRIVVLPHRKIFYWNRTVVLL